MKPKKKAPAKKRASKRKSAQSKAKKSAKKKATTARPKAGASIERTFKGAKHTVKVTADGFTYEGKAVRSKAMSYAMVGQSARARSASTNGRHIGPTRTSQSNEMDGADWGASCRPADALLYFVARQPRVDRRPRARLTLFDASHPPTTAPTWRR